MRVYYCDFCDSRINEQHPSKVLFGGEICDACTAEYKAADRVIEDERRVIRDKLAELDRRSAALASEWRKRKGLMSVARKKGYATIPQTMSGKENISGASMGNLKEDWWTK